MGGTELNDLWPDRRPGSGSGRKRRPRPLGEELPASAPKREADMDPIEGETHLGFIREQEIVVEQCEYVFNEDEDPWEQRHGGLDEP